MNAPSRSAAFQNGRNSGSSKSAPVHVIAYHRALQAKLRYTPFQFLYRRRNVLQRQRGESGEPAGMVFRELRNVVVAVPRHRRRSLGILVVVVQHGVRRKNLHVNPKRVHIRQAFVRRPGSARIVPVRRNRISRYAVPVLACLNRGYKGFRRNVSVYVYRSHRISFSTSARRTHQRNPAVNRERHARNPLRLVARQIHGGPRYIPRRSLNRQEAKKRARVVLRSSDIPPATMDEYTGPGRMQFTRIPRAAWSIAMPCVSAMTPPFDTV